MKRQLAFILFVSLFAACVFSSTFIVGGCGGGGGGGGGGPTPLATGTFTKTESLGSGFSWSSPFVLNPEVREQHLFFAQDIKGSGYIESFSLRYYNDEAVSTNCPDVTIKMGHTSLSALTTTFANNVEQGRGSLVTVLAGAVTIPAGSAGDYFTITLDQPFQYNGVDNLVVEFVRTAACDNNIELDSTGVVYTNVSLQNPSSGAATGTLYNNYPNAKFTFAGGDNEQNFGGTSNNNWPFSSSTPRTQNLYLASEIDGSGPITGLAFQMNAVSTAQTYTATVRMGHTTLAALGTTYADNYDAGAPVIVANAVTFSIPAGIPAGEWFWVPLPTSTFTYNGTDNLIVDVVVTAGSGNTDLRITNIANRRAVGGDNADPVAITVDSNAYHIKLRFNGGTMDAGIGATGFSGQVLENDGDGAEIQSLYHSTELGTGGKIRSISLRMGGDSAAATHANYTIKIGHTAKTAFILADSYASNMDEDSTVYSGTLEVPAGLKAGDWLTIPINSFSYDSTKNLAIYFSTLGNAAGSNLVRWFFSGTRSRPRGGIRNWRKYKSNVD